MLDGVWGLKTNQANGSIYFLFRRDLWFANTYSKIFDFLLFFLVCLAVLKKGNWGAF